MVFCLNKASSIQRHKRGPGTEKKTDFPFSRREYDGEERRRDCDFQRKKEGRRRTGINFSELKESNFFPPSLLTAEEEGKITSKDTFVFKALGEEESGEESGKDIYRD